MQHLRDKNPRRIDGYTPLHAAAEKGHLKLCEHFMENLTDKIGRSCTPPLI